MVYCNGWELKDGAASYRQDLGYDLVLAGGLVSYLGSLTNPIKSKRDCSG